MEVRKTQCLILFSGQNAIRKEANHFNPNHLANIASVFFRIFIVCSQVVSPGKQICFIQKNYAIFEP
jgi:hypothetical protein